MEVGRDNAAFESGEAEQKVYGTIEVSAGNRRQKKLQLEVTSRNAWGLLRVIRLGGKQKISTK